MKRLRYLAALLHWEWFMLCDLFKSQCRSSRCRLYVEAAMKGADEHTLVILQQRAFDEIESKPARPRYSDYAQ